MNEFLKFYKSMQHERGWTLSIYHSSITDQNITVGYKSIYPKHDETIIHVEDCDMELAFAKAQVELKKWLLENEGGY